jgi:outer membrane lipopolysaccharide assembly protein LptE/RlpB
MWSLTKHPLTHLKIVTVFLIVNSLAGCGFELRGQTDRAATLGRYPIAVVSQAPNSEFSSELRSELQRQGAILSSVTEASLILYVDLEVFEQRSLSLTARARAAELELQASVAVSAKLGGEWFIDNERILVTEQMLNDPLNVAGKTEELRLMQSELRSALVDALTRRLDYGIAAYHANQT